MMMMMMMIIMAKVMKSKMTMAIAKIRYLISLMTGNFINLGYYVNYCCYLM